jgi:hypothetical protein
MKENEHIFRAIKSEHHDVVYWKDGGIDIKLDGRWYLRWDGERYVEADEGRAKFLDNLPKKDVRIRGENKG